MRVFGVGGIAALLLGGGGGGRHYPLTVTPGGRLIVLYAVYKEGLLWMLSGVFRIRVP